MNERSAHGEIHGSVRITGGGVVLDGDLEIPPDAHAIVLFAHGSGSGRHSPRNRYVAHILGESGLASLLIDLLTAEEERVDASTGHLRFDIGLLVDRLILAIDWLGEEPRTRALRIGLFGASTGAAAALVAAARQPTSIGAVVSRGGRPDLAGAALRSVIAPTLLIVGGDDAPILGLTTDALHELGAAKKKVVVVPGATHLFEEPGTLDEVARLAADWFTVHVHGLAEGA